LTRELVELSESAGPLAQKQVEEAELRFARLVEAFRDRLSRNMDAALGIALSPLSWEPQRVSVAAPPIAISHVFDIPIDLLWFLLPMRILARLFHRHFRQKIPWEVEKNLSRLAADWSEAVNAAIQELHQQALEWVRTELATLNSLLGAEHSQVEEIRAALSRLELINVKTVAANRPTEQVHESTR
jgi:hypothetical protein